MMQTIKDLLIIAVIFALGYIAVRLWGGIGQPFEPKSYNGYFHARVVSQKVNGAETDAIVKLLCENKFYYVRDIFLLDRGQWRRIHFGGMLSLEDSQIIPFAWSTVCEGSVGEETAWKVIVTNKKPIDFKEGDKEFFAW